MSDESHNPERKLPRFKKKAKQVRPQNNARSILLLGLLVLGVFFTIYKGMGWLAQEDLSAQELFSRVMDGRSDSRRLAAVEWARKLQVAQQREQKAGELSPDLIQQQQLCRILGEIKASASHVMRNEPAYQGALAFVLGFSQIERPAERCLVNLLQDQAAGLSEDFLIQAQLSMGRFGTQPDEEWLKISEDLLRESSLSVRKSTIFSIGSRVKGSEAREDFLPLLKTFLFSSDLDLRWNASLVLGSWGDPSALSVFEDLLEWVKGLDGSGQYNGALKDWPPVLTQSHFEFIERVFRQILNFQDPDLRTKLAAISESHPHIRLRLLAKEALQSQN